MQLHFQHFGSGFPVVILHGLFGSSDNWQNIGKRLAPQYSVFLPDQRNHGRSPHSDELNFPLMASDLKELFSSQGIGKAHLIGHSMGGKTAMEFALTFPDAVEKLIVVDISPKRYPRSHDQIFDAILGTDASKFTTRSAVDAVLQEKIPDTATRYFLLKNLQSTEGGGLKWKINTPAIFAHYPELLEAPPAKGQFNGPTLFLRGGKSNYVLDEDDALIRSRFPAATIRTIDRADHWVHADAPNEFLQEVLGFLEG